MKLFISPHNDDETLFGAFTIMKEKPVVVVVFDSYVQVARGNTDATRSRRRTETSEAVAFLLSVTWSLRFLGLRDDAPDYDYFRDWLKQSSRRGAFDGLICPAWEQDGHEQHNDVARICRDLWPAEQRTEYLTYTRTRGRSRSICNADFSVLPAHEVIPTPDMIARKHRALACYSSQMEVENCRDWFLGDLREYVILPPASGGGKP